MYRIEDRSAYIRILQNFLNVQESGRYDIKTKEAVLAHQKESGLPITGEVDYRTFLSIKDAYKSRAVKEDNMGLSHFPYRFGMWGDDVALINSMLAAVLPVFSIDHTPPRGRYFGIDSENAVKYLRGVFMLGEDKTIDPEFFRRLKKEYLILSSEKDKNQ